MCVYVCIFLLTGSSGFDDESPTLLYSPSFTHHEKRSVSAVAAKLLTSQTDIKTPTPETLDWKNVGPSCYEQSRRCKETPDCKKAVHRFKKACPIKGFGVCLVLPRDK